MSLVSTCQSDVHKLLDIVQEAFSGKKEHRDKYECETYLGIGEELDSYIRKNIIYVLSNKKYKFTTVALMLYNKRFQNL